MNLGSQFASEICQICEEVRDACTDECEKHHHEHCRRCAEACRLCADECRKMAGAGV
jgi:hypothetical protein